MSLETKKMLKLFGVSVTDFEEESKVILERSERLKSASVDEKLKLLRDSFELVNEVHLKWIEVTQFILENERKLINSVIKALEETP
ncbi:MAG: hypothetical protein QXX95_08285 [Nitrososphaerales archaeon]